MSDWSTKLDQMRERAAQGGGPDRVQRQHEKGKRTARERINALVDPDSFLEIGLFAAGDAGRSENGKPGRPGDGVVTGRAAINGRQVFLFAQDFTVLGGSVGRVHGQKIARVMDLAVQSGSPLIGLNDSGGARIQEGVKALGAYGEIFNRNVAASGVIPQLSLILGPCAGGAVYSPAITDFVFMAQDTSQMFITGPDVIKEVTQEEIDLDSLGGAGVHTDQSGVAHFLGESEEDVFDRARLLLSYLPDNNLAPLPVIESADDPHRNTPELADCVPASPKEPYDVRDVITVLVDGGEFLEVQESYARNIVIGFGRLDGIPVGLIANQPDHFAGVLDINASDKAARFIRTCDAFHIPLLTLVDTPGFLPGVDQEHEGIIRHGAKMIFAYAEATVPKITLILRKAYGGAYIVMGSKHLHGDHNLAWPNAEIAVMGPKGAVKILHRKEIQRSDQPEDLRKELTESYRNQMASPFLAAGEGYLDDIIKPAESRRRIIKSLQMLLDKRVPTPQRKHGNIPL
jgi:acetyl-CoA carboxylase carboxyltransferase component